MVANLFMEGGFTNLAPYAVEVFGVRRGARAAGLNLASNGLGKILGPASLAIIAGTGNLLTPYATEQAILPGFLFLSVCALGIGLAFTFLGPETHGKPLAMEDDEAPARTPAALAVSGRVG
jgi:putative MFS transporter